MNKKDLVDHVADGAELSKAKAETALNAFIDGIKASLQQGNKVTIVGFGTFSVTERAARNGRNPKTGETIRIPASKAPKFSPGKDLKAAVK